MPAFRLLLRPFICAAFGSLALLSMASLAGAQAPAPDPEKARRLALATADWQLMLSQLQLTLPTLPPAATDPTRPAGTTQHPGFNSWFDTAGNRYIRSSWGRWTNYDEATAGTTTRPDPLVLRTGRPVREAATWYRQRRPEILTDFAREVYGTVPKSLPAVHFVAAPAAPWGPGGQVLRQVVEGQLDNARYPAATPRLRLVLYRPAAATGPVPLVVVVSSTPAGADPAAAPAALPLVLGAGWALATIDPTDWQMDSGAGLRAGIIGLANQGRPRQPADWGTLAAWSWGLSRVLDYVATDPALDARRVAVQGHSRWGKTALLAAATDPRWALAYVSCSGAMGASLEKRNFGETLDNTLEANEYHWLAGNCLKYAGRWDTMPTDAHELVALVAPRPLLLTAGTTDTWTDARGTFLAAVGASPVYRLLGAHGLATNVMPAPDGAPLGGELAFREHTGGHTDAPDWPVFIEFARKYLAAPAVANH